MSCPLTALLQIPYFPPLQSQQDFAPDACAKIIAAAASVPQLALNVHTIKAWTMNAQVADRWAWQGACARACAAASATDPSVQRAGTARQCMTVPSLCMRLHKATPMPCTQ